jgi:hypothetical protein
MRLRRAFYFAVGALALIAATAMEARAHPITLDLNYTRFADSDRVKRVTTTFDGSTFTLGTPTTIAGIGNGMVGADGIAFDPFNGHILIGAQTSIVHRINPVGPVVSSASTSGPAAFHLAVDPGLGFVWASGIPGTLSKVPIGAAFGTPGTVVPVVGSHTALTQIIFTPSGTTYYTASGPGGFGAFGTVVLGPTAVTSGLFSSLPAAHGGIFDPFTGDIILFGDNHVTQIGGIGAIPFIKSDLDLATLGLSLQLDQGTVDGAGHIYAASNTGHLFFLDYSGTGLVAAGSNFFAAPFLDTFLDDVAPLVGPGSQAIPEPTTITLAFLAGISTLALARSRRRKVHACSVS